MSSVGIIGAGAIATAIATRLASARNINVTLSNSRGPASLKNVVAGLSSNVQAGTVAEAAAADIVILSVPWSKIPAALGQVEDWTGKVLIDTTNPLEAPTYRMADLGGQTSSEIVAQLAPGALVVKAFNTHNPQVLATEPRVGGGRRVMFYSGDDASAKRTVAGLLAALGFEGIDLGGLVAGGSLHQFPGGSLPSRDLIQI